MEKPIAINKVEANNQKLHPTQIKGKDNMKRILMLLCLAATVVFNSCSKETTYTIVDNTSGFSSFTEYSILACEYDNSGSIVFTNKLDWPEKGKSYVYTANDYAEKIKVRIQAKIGTNSFNRWVQQVFYLEKGKNITISISDDTIVGTNEP